MPYVKRLLAFRNRFARQPYLHARFMDENDLEYAIKTNTKLIHVRWPLHPDVTSRTPSAGTVRSLDGHCALFLEPHRQAFKVTFPIAISDPERTLTASKYIKQPYKFVYVRITQIYSVRDAPDCWRYPLALAMHQYGDRTSVPLDDFPTDSVQYVTSAIPQSIGEVLLDADFDPLQESHHQRPIVMWTDEAIYRVIRRRTDPNAKLEVEAVIHSDGALFRGVSDFRFIEFHANEMHANADYEIFVAEAAPTFVTNHATGAQYHLELLLRHLLDMYRQGLQDPDGDYESTEVSSKAHIRSSSTIVSQAFPGLGVFTAYANGRMSAVFEDRTLIETDAERRLAVVTDQHGERLVIRCKMPIGFEKHMRLLQRFAASIWKDDNLGLEPAKLNRAINGCLVRSRIFLEGRAAGRNGVADDDQTTSDNVRGLGMKTALIDVLHRNKKFIST
ncbi:hypothetical protein HDU85_006186 [Gaertneriomyces sp. JEL0708]|nr:hypothetical protein HDU85_006186 [Gaertneriomyces sp. JEL0708]